MNIPSGKQVVSELATSGVDPKKMLGDLMKKNFNGYVSVTCKERFGFEDGFVILENGVIKGSYYKMLKNQKDAFGKDALALLLNAFGSGFGTIDIFMLTKEQVDLMLTFNEKVKFEASDLSKIKDLFKNKYDPNLLGNYIEVQETTSKYDLFKKIGLGNIKI